MYCTLDSKSRIKLITILNNDIYIYYFSIYIENQEQYMNISFIKKIRLASLKRYWIAKVHTLHEVFLGENFLVMRF